MNEIKRTICFDILNGDVAIYLDINNEYVSADATKCGEWFDFDSKDELIDWLSYYGIGWKDIFDIDALQVALTPKYRWQISVDDKEVASLPFKRYDKRLDTCDITDIQKRYVRRAMRFINWKLEQGWTPRG